MTKWSPTDDPNAQNEAQKYDNPVPSREFIMDLLAERGVLLSHEQICAAFGIVEDEQVEAMRRRLRAMERDGQLTRNRRDSYGVTDKLDLVAGVIIGHRDGFGFLKPDLGGADLYLSPRQMRCGFDGDKALVRKAGIDSRGRVEGTIVRILEHNTHQVVGRYQVEGGVAFLRPESTRICQDIVIPSGSEGGADNGQLVVVEISTQPSYRTPAQGRVIEILGDHLAPGVEIDVAIRNYGIPHEWPEAVQAAADRFAPKIEEAALKGRIDLRGLPLCTIDGEDAKDFDDAIYCERRKRGGWRLIVAIADVSHYVRPLDALDVEARKRGNSVYFPEFVVPMLPEVLSNGLCSLNPNVDRLALACDMNISAAGAVTRYRFCDAVIRSHARLTYTQVGEYLQSLDTKNAAQLKEARARVAANQPQLATALESAYELFHALRAQREERGAIDFETVETRIVFGEDRKIQTIKPTVRNDAHKLIEEAMLSANVCAARLLQKHGLLGTYRNHEGPKEEKLEKLRLFLKEMGVEFSVRGKIKPADYQAALAQVEGRPDAGLIQTVMLRSMNQAVYSPENLGHFGLAYPAYTHFTSPIRRYPDLLVHRAIRSLIRSQRVSTHVERTVDTPIQAAAEFPYNAHQMLELSEHCSGTERRADEATRDVVSWLKCEFMVDKEGQQFPGIISAVTNFGFFVALDDIYVEGLVHVSNLNSDYYHFDPIRHRLTGERTGVHFALGDPVKVEVVRVSLDDRKIDFELISGGKHVRWSKHGKAATTDVASKANKPKSSKKKLKAHAKSANGKSANGKSANGKSANKNSANGKKSASGKAAKREERNGYATPQAKPKNRKEKAGKVGKAGKAGKATAARIANKVSGKASGNAPKAGKPNPIAKKKNQKKR
ncbi:3\'-5\' exoribonuclease [gamma proteobacterium HdN1]|nr:3\'-5\' exoribonuclease [gamma proteobacterium HdN1]